MAGKNTQGNGKQKAAAVIDETVTHLQVRALSEGFRRAGRAWPATPVIVPVDEFDEAQIEQLLAEPMLVVAPVAEAGKGEGK